MAADDSDVVALSPLLAELESVSSPVVIPWEDDDDIETPSEFLDDDRGEHEALSGMNVVRILYRSCKS